MSKRNANKKSKSVAKSAPLQDLIVLVADKDIKETIEGLLTKRTRSLGIRPVQYKVLPNNEHDPGCLDRSAELLASFCTTHAHAMVIFDREGCGQDTESRSELEATVETALRKAGWGDRTAAIVIDPELENWVWSPSPHVADCLGWRDPKQSYVTGFWRMNSWQPPNRSNRQSRSGRCMTCYDSGRWQDRPRSTVQSPRKCQ